jgi:hypothetical protein
MGLLMNSRRAKEREEGMEWGRAVSKLGLNYIALILNPSSSQRRELFY